MIAAAMVGAQESDAEDAPVASAGDLQFTQADWQRLITTDYRLVGATARSRSRIQQGLENILGGELQNMARERHIEESGWVDNPDIQRRIAAAERESLAAKMVEIGVLNHFEVSREEIDAEFANRWDSTGGTDRLVIDQIYFDLTGLSEEEQQAKRTQAQSVLESIQASPERFTELMHMVSDSATQQSIGPIERDQTHDVLADPLWALEVGEVTDVLESPAGLHIFRIVRREPAVPEVVLRRQISNDLSEAKYEEWLAESRLSTAAELGLEFPDLPDVISASVPLVTGAVSITGADLLASVDLDATAEVAASDHTEEIDDLRTEALLAEMARQGMWITPVQLNEALTTGHRIIIQQIDNEIWRSQAGEVTDEDIQAYYSDNLQRFTQPVCITALELELRPGRNAQPGERFAMHDILVVAEDIRAQWEAGANFADLVDEYTTAASGEERVRRIASTDLSRRLFEAVSDLATGEVSAPIALGDGYQLFQVLSVEHNRLRPLEEVTDQVRASLGNIRQSQARSDWDTAFNESLEINITDEMIDHFHISPVEAPSPASGETASPEAS